MSDQSDENIVYGEILVALDSSRHSEAALEAAVELAKALRANMRGLFVHDTTWLQISRLPAVMEVSDFTGEIKPLGIENVEQQIRILEERIHKRFEQVNRRHKITYTWNTAEGNVIEKVLEAAKDADLITIGRKGQSYFQRNKLGRTAKAVIHQCNKPVLILQEGLRLGQSVIAIYDGTKQSRKGVRLAIDLAEYSKSRLVIVSLGDIGENQENGTTHDSSLAGMTENLSVTTELLMLKQPGINEFLNIVNRYQGGMLVLAKSNPILEKHSIELLLEHLNNPILLMN